jgi:hypothetical protein
MTIPWWAFVAILGALLGAKLLYDGLKSSAPLRQYIRLSETPIGGVAYGDGPLRLSGTAKSLEANADWSAEDTLVVNEVVREVNIEHNTTAWQSPLDPNKQFESGPHGTGVARVGSDIDSVPFVLESDRGERILVDPRAANYLLDTETEHGEKSGQVVYRQVLTAGETAHVGGRIVPTADLDIDGLDALDAEVPDLAIRAVDGRIFLAHGDGSAVATRLLTKHYRLPLGLLVLAGVGVYVWSTLPG